MKIAVIGSGISGLTAAWLLSKKYHVDIYEANDEIGGHTATKLITLDGESHAIDTGFIVFNDRTYPNFNRLLRELDVPFQNTEMSFSVCCDRTGIEYSGSSLNGLLAQRSNLFRPYFMKMVKDILRFNKQAPIDLDNGKINAKMTLGEYLRTENYSAGFINQYLIPMGAAIWSSGSGAMLDFPLQFFVRFFKNHGLLSLKNRPQWSVITGGSREYLKPLCEPFSHNIKTGSAVEQVIRKTDGVSLRIKGRSQHYDQVIIATHSDQALKLLTDASDEEKEVLSSIPYAMNDVVLHTDNSLLPKKKRAWSAWNYHVYTNSRQRAALTYNMNLLQGIDSKHTFCVTLNESEHINPSRILGRYQYAHPVFTLEGMAAQQRWQEINGVHHTWFCGAYWNNGFHEDGVVSAVKVAKALGVS
ncbi:MAG: FAD-dependent oxidoreductase, partial [Pseudomonadales bacterium]|nr:FAD-dependent oxidoreductase [Pseudomonadales bacterium]